MNCGAENIPNACDVAFTVRSYEAGIANHVTLPTLCNYMQEAAGVNAARLGWGIQDLQAEGLTWMLSRLRVGVIHYVPWGETVTVRTPLFSAYSVTRRMAGAISRMASR